MIDLVQISTILVLFNKIEIINISGDIGSTKKADNILEIPEQGEFCSYCFKNHKCERRLTTECFK